MISTFFLSVLYSFLAWFLSLLPIVVFPPQISQAITTMWGLLNAFSFLWPVATMVALFVLASVYYAIAFTVDISLWIIRFFRGN